MKTVQLETSNPLILLVEPDIERDSVLGVEWLQGKIGRDTLQLMGVPDKDNVPTDIVKERERVSEFVSNEDQLNWMIQYDNAVVGSVWVDLTEKEGLRAPSVHIMIGDPNARGKGIGSASIASVIDYLHSQGNTTVYSRHLLANVGSAKLLSEQGFVDDGDAYIDQDGLNYQNMLLALDEI